MPESWPSREEREAAAKKAAEEAAAQLMKEEEEEENKKALTKRAVGRSVANQGSRILDKRNGFTQLGFRTSSTP